MDMNDL